MLRFLVALIVSIVAVSCGADSTENTAQTFDAGIALASPVINTSPGPQYGDDTRQFQGIPAIELTTAGNVWAAWYGGGSGEGPYNYVIAVRSKDRGETWSAPLLVIDPPDPVRGFDPALWRDPTGKLWLTWSHAAGRWDGRGGVWVSVSENPDAEQPAWSPPRRIADGVMLNKPTVLNDGRWLFPIAGWRFKEPTVEEALAGMGLPDAKAAAAPLVASMSGHDGSMVYVSSDQGRTVTYLGEARIEDTQHDEHSIIERKNGDLWMLARTTYGIGQSVSTDGGKSWSQGGPSGIPHPVTRFHVSRLKSGRILLVRNNPEDQKARTHMTAYLSEDDGVTWIGGLLLDERQVSYPDATQAQTGEIYVIYDRERAGARQILMARILEEDILSGKLVNDDSRLSVVINQATGERAK